MDNLLDAGVAGSSSNVGHHHHQVNAAAVVNAYTRLQPNADTLLAAELQRQEAAEFIVERNSTSLAVVPTTNDNNDQIDMEMSAAMYATELEQYVQSFADRTMAASIQRAVLTDEAALAHEAEQSELAQHDRALA
eukprot:7889419-Pyramimonas_sp.AAC.1